MIYMQSYFYYVKLKWLFSFDHCLEKEKSNVYATVLVCFFKKSFFGYVVSKGIYFKVELKSNYLSLKFFKKNYFWYIMSKKYLF